ncbi:branched-chain amino acid aminotransferase [Neobacillus drentensis]|uniref:branched-chain amino acid aminotransferase n=1 Tax=Neobacillus drentensis TaxID=220684 RepID=UPI003000CDB6
MLKDKIIQYIRVNQKDDSIILFEEEIDYLKNYNLVEEVQFVKKDASTRFEDAYIERCDKETESMIRNESSAFLSEPVGYLKKHKNEFIYLESKWFDLVNVDAISLEADDVFGTYDVMLGLKLQKKFEKVLKELLDVNLHGDEAKFDLIFSHEDGLWNLNFALNFVEGFTEEITIDEAFQLIYRFLFKLNEAVEGK